jgi:hypothetical protein
MSMRPLPSHTVHMDRGEAKSWDDTKIANSPGILMVAYTIHVRPTANPGHHTAIRMHGVRGQAVIGSLVLLSITCMASRTRMSVPRRPRPPCTWIAGERPGGASGGAHVYCVHRSDSSMDVDSGRIIPVGGTTRCMCAPPLEPIVTSRSGCTVYEAGRNVASLVLPSISMADRTRMSMSPPPRTPCTWTGVRG